MPLVIESHPLYITVRCRCLVARSSIRLSVFASLGKIIGRGGKFVTL